ncbi:hypothetical protein J7I80_05965 [Bacillus sp. ISL-41]|uniref:immunoglobulin-like domain-containing protein n=1 Tax=Bacillus sp. ISL-41 TaxID=2819127 RepID=UPI001BE6ABC9|nr:immunoglobulin-like domain-containing protein [Bacillus sp. ISL-41]MBT2641761.1 hypothetical protein [Bacillus sp. ISL-41]
MNRVAILLTGALLLTGCTSQQEPISQNEPLQTKVATDQKIKSKYRELTSEDQQNNLRIALMMHPIKPAPEFSFLEIYNNGSHTFLSSPEYTVEKFIDGAWYEVPFPKEASLEGRTEYIGPNGGYHQKINNKMLDEMISEEGKYRLLKVLKAKEKGQQDLVLAHTITVGAKN